MVKESFCLRHLPLSIVSNDTLLEGWLSFERGLYWNIVPQYCEHILIRGITVNSFDMDVRMVLILIQVMMY